MAKTDLNDTVLQHDPRIHPDAFIAASADIIGDVRIGKDASVWYGAVLRGDINYIEIGERSNIQDGCVCHLENDRPCIVGQDVTVGHRAILHGCTLEDGCLIGMGATILNGAVIKKGAIVGANTLVKENTIVEANTMVVGVPSRLVKTMTGTYEENIKWALKYVMLSKRHSQKKTTS